MIKRRGKRSIQSGREKKENQKITFFTTEHSKENDYLMKMTQTPIAYCVWCSLFEKICV